MKTNRNEVDRNNKLIAEFMNAELTKYNRYKFSFGTVYEINELLYHSSWDWLMPVVEKIESIPFNLKSVIEFCKVYISCHNEIGNSFPYCQIWVNEDKQFSIEDRPTKIEAVWFAIIEFIKWYNKNGK